MFKHSRLRRGRSRLAVAAGLAGALLLACGLAPAAVAADSETVLDKRAARLGNPDSPYRWDRYLRDTYWYVPPDALPAQLHRASEVIPIEQQTIYYIDSAERGVFSGWMVTQFTTERAGIDLPISCQDMFGTIAPGGEISLTVVTPSTGGVNKPWPVAYMTNVRGHWWTMVLASTIIGDSSMFITHGPTYMKPIGPRSRFWTDLPGSPGNVPEFVSQCGHAIE